MNFDRRRFLELVALSGVGVYLPGCSDDGDGTKPAAGAPGNKVLVLGAGLAGLSAAYELMKKGYDVTVLEAQAHGGGRVRTVREGFEGDQYYELGAVRIPDVHEHTIGYVEELGLELVEFTSGDPLYYLKGNRFMHTEGSPWPLMGMTAEEQAEGLGMWSTYVAAHFEEFGDPRKGEFPKAGIEDMYDGMTWAEFLKSKGASDDWMTLYTADNGTEITKIGAMAWMAAEVADQAWDKTFTTKGGNGQIAEKLIEALGARVLFERPVVKIEHDAAGATVHFTNGGATETLRADHLVCAIPFTTLRKIDVSPQFPADKAAAIEELYMMPSTRAYIQTKTRFWEAEGIGGVKIVKTDTPAERVWDLSNPQPGDTGVLMVYTQHENATAFAAVPSADREAYILGHVEEFFPQIGTERTAFAVKAWSEDPWVEGAWTDLLPQQWKLFAVNGRAEGRVHFAGEHTSIWAGWMQGAIESGKRAAQEIAGG